LKMANKERTEIDIAIILTPNEQGAEKIFGIPAVRRNALLCSQTGFTEIHIAGITKPFRQLLSDLAGPDRFHPIQDREELVDLAGAILGSRPATDVKRILILRSDVLIDKTQLLKLVHTDGPGIFYMESGDGQERIFLTPSRHLSSLLKHAWAPGPYPETGGDASLVKGSGGLPGRVSGRGNHEAAERELLSALRDQTKATDGFMSRHVSRHISLAMSARLALTPITPNQVTILGAAIGLLGAALLAGGGYSLSLAGCLLFLLCIIVDGVDGEIARLKLQESDFGHNLDIVCDNIVHVAIFTGLAAGCYRQSGNYFYIYLWGILLVGFALSGTVVYYRILKAPPEIFRSKIMARILPLMSNRDFAYLMVLLAAAGVLHWFLIGSAFGAYIFAAVLWISTNPGKNTAISTGAGSKMQIN